VPDQSDKTALTGLMRAGPAQSAARRDGRRARLPGVSPVLATRLRVERVVDQVRRKRHASPVAAISLHGDKGFRDPAGIGQRSTGERVYPREAMPHRVAVAVELFRRPIDVSTAPPPDIERVQKEPLFLERQHEQTRQQVVRDIACRVRCAGDEYPQRIVAIATHLMQSRAQRLQRQMCASGRQRRVAQVVINRAHTHPTGGVLIHHVANQ